MVEAVYSVDAEVIRRVRAGRVLWLIGTYDDARVDPNQFSWLSFLAPPKCHVLQICLFEVCPVGVQSPINNLSPIIRLYGEISPSYPG